MEGDVQAGEQRNQPDDFCVPAVLADNHLSCDHRGEDEEKADVDDGGGEPSGIGRKKIAT